ncbi:hypothetical protein [Quadrisphaera sp. DSM 44207]|uniref:hypothetical protein n=1 Tax=Quadrisphaera sp. DSM 44207 TaxID=1881057 RepID=UPI000AAED04D|nr:hypothetical protein [Quadrisphaera sp. DSM 44207]
MLRPAAVDPWSRYRRYSAEQLQDALLLKVLRAADVPLARAARALTGRQEGGVVLAEHRARIAAERARQDEAVALAAALLEGGAQQWHAQERTAEAQPCAGVVLTVPVDGEDGDEDGAVHPAVVTPLVRAERRGAELELAGMRQVGLLEDGQVVGVEVAVPVARR